VKRSDVRRRGHDANNRAVTGRHAVLDRALDVAESCVEYFDGAANALCTTAESWKAVVDEAWTDNVVEPRRVSKSDGEPRWTRVSVSDLRAKVTYPSLTAALARTSPLVGSLRWRQEPHERPEHKDRN
jgi:hypothetical protein